MGQHDGKIIINGATSQFDRWLPALGAGYAQVDDRSFAELLRFPTEFGSLINFYDLSNSIDGDWVEFFAGDPSIILACIEAFDLADAERAFLDLERRTLERRHFEEKFALLCEVFAAVARLAREVNRWLAVVGRDPRGENGRLLRQQLVAAIDGGLGAQLRLLADYAEGAGLPEALGRPVPLDLAGFLTIWELGHVCALGSIYHGGSRSRKIDHALPYLTAIFMEFRDAISRLAAFARLHLPGSLAQADHRPDVALYITFARLFQTAQDTINTVSPRYVDFYYRDILRESFRALVPDHVYLAFTLAAQEGVTSTTVPRDTLFPAGQDGNGIDILYAADKSLLVTAAAIAKLRTLRVVSGPLIPAASPDEATFGDAAKKKFGDEVTLGILQSEIAAGDQKAGAGAPAPWSTFGEAEPGSNASEVTTPASLGFALASPYLLLTGGERCLKLRLVFKPDSFAAFMSLLRRLEKVTWLEPETIFHDVLQKAFTLYASTADGWLAIESYKVCPLRADEPEFTLEIELPPAVAPIVAYDPAAQTGPAAAAPADIITGGVNPDPAQPTLKACLRQGAVTLGSGSDQVSVSPLSLIAVLDLVSWEIQNNVAKLTQLQLSNTDGFVDPSKPFLLLGAPPVLGSFLEIRHLELFAKTLETLSITIKWFNLPQNDNGFKGWYRDYVIGLNGKRQESLFDNTTFRAGICVVNPGRWEFMQDTPGGPVPAVCADGSLCLFRTHAPGATDCPDTTPDGPLCAVTDFKTLTVSPHGPRAYYNAADSAIRLQLTAPSYAFGDDLYTQNVLSAVISDLPDPKTGEPAKCQEWKMLWDAAQWLGACLEKCSECPDSEYETCITPCLLDTLARMLLEVVACLMECLAQSKELWGDAQFARLQGSLAALANPADADRASKIKRWIEDCRASADPAAPLLPGKCFDRCTILLDVVIGIIAQEVTCATQQPPQYAKQQSPPYKTCMVPYLKACKAQLEQPYEECCKDLNYPNPPWLPQAQSVEVTYSARCPLPGAVEPCGRFFHLLPFDGYSEPAIAQAPPLLPRFRYPGNLYIGFSGLVPPQGLTLLFQMAAGGGWSGMPPSVAWEYLAGNSWTPLTPAQLLSDGTNGLQNSGILAFSLPRYDPSGTTVLDADHQWLHAAVAGDPAKSPKTSYIYPNALLATWTDNGSVEHLNKPLPANTITGSVQALPDIAGIAQPMESFGGRPPETGRSFQTWLGERLRHKDRGILGWDYERLVLEQFPAVWKVQTLPARDMDKGAVPGSVLVVVVPGPNSTEVMDATAPAASADTLAQIGASLKGAISAFVKLSVANPNYVRITVHAQVQFSDAEDPGTCIKRLDEELVRYLSPWFYDAARAAKGGDYASEDEISEFVQTRPYVDALISMRLTHAPDPQTLDWYFLTSAKEHDINPWREGNGVAEDAVTDV